MRIIDFPNLFKKKRQKDTNFEISLTISSDDEAVNVNIPIIFSKTSEGQTLRFQLCNQTSDRPKTSQLLSKVSNKPFGSDFKEVFLFTYINPIFLLPTNEPQHSNGYILNKLHEAKANEVIRNMIYLISPEKKTIKKEKKEEAERQLSEYTKPVIYCEGVTDVKILKQAYLILYKELLLKENFKQIQNFHFQKIFKKDNFSKEEFINNHFLMLPIPNNRIELSTYYEENGFIEYMFEDEVLENKLNVELIEEKGRTHKIIKTEIKKDKNNKQVVNSEKQKVIKNISNLSKEDFKHFIPLFEKIAEIIGYQLPAVSFDN